MLTLLLAESELERIPASLSKHPVVVSSAQKRGKKPGEILLDSNYHHAAMHRLPEGERRGRPDIVHLFLLVALDSLVNKKEALRVLVHTRNDECVTFDPETRIMRNYDRFTGLMEQLYEHHVVPDETKPLIRLTPERTLSRILSEGSCDAVIAFSSLGKPVSLPVYFSDLWNKKKKDILCVIGGFPKGEFHNDMMKLADDVVSLYSEMVPAWTIASEVLVNYENVFCQKY